MADRFTEQKKTLTAAVNILKKTHKCVIVRPTGFGKTWLLTELIKNYNKVLYLYPSAIIRDTVVHRYYGSMFNKNTETYVDEYGREYDQETVSTFMELNEIKNCDLMTYARLVRLTDEEIDSMDYDLVIFDEGHRIGGTLTKIAVEKLFAKLNETTDYIAATATPTRMDNFDFISHFFADNMVYPYTMFDAIKDGLIKKPYYCYATYDIETDLKEAAFAAGENIKDPEIKEILNSKLIEISNIYNMPSIIKDVCDKHAIETSYMKFIVFFASKKHMDDKLSDVVTWFKTAYPDHEINTIKISSHTTISAKNIEKLDTLVRKDNHIDIIACIDMMNMGYHPNKSDNCENELGLLTGIIMYRGTKSNTIFTQQLGRAFSTGSDYASIIFDIVDNLHRQAVYELRKNLVTRKSRQKLHSTGKRETNYMLGDDNTTIFLVHNDEKILSQYHMTKEGIIVDKNDQVSTMQYDRETKRIFDYGSVADTRKQTEFITPECLIATGHEATYRELLAKAVAEPMTQRCKYALELHFKSWCYQHGVKYPITKKSLKRLYSLDKADFYKEFCQILRKNEIKYPLDDIHALLAMGANDDEIPLNICAKARSVSVAQILDMMGVSVQDATSNNSQKG